VEMEGVCLRYMARRRAPEEIGAFAAPYALDGRGQRVASVYSGDSARAHEPRIGAPCRQAVAAAHAWHRHCDDACAPCRSPALAAVADTLANGW
jgi:hypothetical protein